MTDYSKDYVTEWKSGQSPEWDYPISSEETLRAVLHDQTYMLYSIFKDDVAGFAEWVALQWQEDNDPLNDDDSAEDYLDRIDVRIVSRPSIGSGTDASLLAEEILHTAAMLDYDHEEMTTPLKIGGK